MGKRLLLASLVLTSLGLVSCGGEVGALSATITGVVVDVDDDPVRDARVFTTDASTTTSPSGAYQLRNVRTGIVQVTAEATRGNTQYRGRNTSFNFDGEQTNNINIVVAPVGQLGRVSGIVRDRQGFVLQNAWVFAYSGVGSAARVFTDINGRYTIHDLIGGRTYLVSAGGPGFRSDQASVVIQAGQTRTLNFSVEDGQVVTPPAPTNLDAVTWVSPTDATRSVGADPYKSIKKHFDNRYKPADLAAPAPEGRVLRDDLIVEANLFWDEVNNRDVIGHGIYRGVGGGNLFDYDFAPDPLAAFYVDIGLNLRSTYRYAVTALSSLFPDFANFTESGLSNIVTVQTLDHLRLGNVTTQPLTFRWQGGSQAQEVLVFIYDEFPGVDVGPIYVSPRSPEAQRQFVYPDTAPPLQAGRTYWYVLLGVADFDAARTISQIDSFQR